MINSDEKLLLVGDNPFHGISHLSQEQARSRAGKDFSIKEKAEVVTAAIKNGANGFSFSVSEVTLSILKELRERREIESLKLYAIVPYAFEYVRIATQTGTPGLAKKFAKQIAISGDIEAIFGGLSTLLFMRPEALLKTYLAYEISRIRSTAGRKAVLSSLLLHEVITDMSLALNFDWLFKSYVYYLNTKGITPGFNTRNFPYLVKKFDEWNINLNDILIETQFNEAGFQMNPSREECEKVLFSLKNPIVIAISVLAAGYFTPYEAANYLHGLKNLKGVAVGVSSISQANSTFNIFSQGFKDSPS
jgi:hypothetical protein